MVMGVDNSLLTVSEVLKELRIPRSTWYLWRQTGRAPRVYKLPNGELRVRRSVLEAWLSDLESEAA
ncbi:MULTISPECIES: AlpA family transcriptional regulator [Micromonospora]|uniref:Helix-turn-helix domain-containing protein n=1 Tax=Micromonospora antibiotica TaxID=2807623 RepID=A0ABS3VAG8_9ACTN|nr:MULTISPECIES: helix-turn-helix domain-containing protein [Micromonospora]MBO4162628.1 helix-turn-helix domain-containing protein [Micromonospora antibiotica]MBW4703326.1 helix-turn-helix domain-containing protein [Micromonospora sp. RL09-050-HVF-A]